VTADSTTQQPLARGIIRAPRGATLSCKGWQQEATLRMLMNSLDPDVAVHPVESPRHEATLEAIRRVENNETLFVQDGTPAGISGTQEIAPRVLISKSNPSSQAASSTWTCIGTQGFIHGAYEMFASAAREHFDGTLAGKLVVSAGMAGADGAFPLAAKLNGGAFLGIDAEPERIKRCVKAGYCDVMVSDLDESLRILKNAVRKREPASVGLIGNCADLISTLDERGIVPDLLAYRTSALLPGALELQKLGAVMLEYGNGIRALGEGRTPLCWVALSGESSDIYRIDRLLLELFPEDEMLARWIALARKHLRFQGLPARVCWLSYGDAAKFGLALNEIVGRGEVKAPIVIARERLDSTLVAMSDGPMLATNLRATYGASWVSIEGGTYTGQPRQIGLAVVADGTSEMAARIEQVLSHTPGTVPAQDLGPRLSRND
jgi:urocanate hydratase